MKRLAIALCWSCLLGATALAGPPAEAPGVLRAFVGQYGDPDNALTLFERNGGIYADGRGFSSTPLKLGNKGRLSSNDGAEVIAGPAGVRLGGALLPPRDFGAETEAGIRRTVRADSATLRAKALVATPPQQPTPARPSNLVNLATVDPQIRLDIRYATANNFMGMPLYERAAAYLQRPAAEALGRVQAALRAQGYGLLIHDAYRPWSVTWMFWEATPEASRMFVADPAKGSRHNRGCAVDLTLYDLKTGKVVEMPSRYDEMSPRAYADFPGGTSRQRWFRDLLRQAMTAEGFEVLAEEWWQFDYRDWPNYGIGNTSFAGLSRPPR